MNKFASIFFLLAVCMNCHAQLRWNSAYQNYIDQYKDLAIQEMFRYSIPASITLAQGLFESAAGRSELSVKGNNHFGIKCHGWEGRTLYHDDDESGECFRAYNNVFESFEDHSKFLARQPRYASLFRLDRRDYKGWARGLKACGYATNPNYADRLIEIIQLYKLYTYDQASSYDKFMAHHSATDRPAVKGQALHPISIYNKNYCIRVRPGDTFKLIGKEIGISYRKIAKFNERDKNDALVPNEIIYLKKKRKHAEKVYKNRPHIVRAGESMYSIAQFYGIRLKSLYKMNHLEPDHDIRVGEVLRVY